MNQWTVGDVKITRVVEIESLGGSRFILPDANTRSLPALYMDAAALYG
jgi:hypothetical protein